MSKHTPGPWGCVCTSYHAHDYRITSENGLPLPFNSPHNDHSEQRANAALIAAAPELLKAVQLAESAMSTYAATGAFTPGQPSGWLLRELRVAIAKAEGGAA